MRPPPFAPGFRVSFIDGLVLAFGVAGSIVLWSTLWWAGLCIGFVVGHFFLFCNVFRISRKRELVWASVFLLLACSTILCGFPGWLPTFSLSVLLTVILIRREMTQPSYHGIFWQKINPVGGQQGQQFRQIYSLSAHVLVLKRKVFCKAKMAFGSSQRFDIPRSCCSGTGTSALFRKHHCHKQHFRLQSASIIHRRSTLRCTSAAPSSVESKSRPGEKKGKHQINRPCWSE